MSLKIYAFRRINVHIWRTGFTIQVDPGIGFFIHFFAATVVYKSYMFYMQTLQQHKTKTAPEESTLTHAHAHAQLMSCLQSK